MLYSISWKTNWSSASGTNYNLAVSFLCKLSPCLCELWKRTTKWSKHKHKQTQRCWLWSHVSLATVPMTPPRNLESGPGYLFISIVSKHFFLAMSKPNILALHQRQNKPRILSLQLGLGLSLIHIDICSRYTDLFTYQTPSLWVPEWPAIMLMCGWALVHWQRLTQV